jgi:hypothetical protein
LLTDLQCCGSLVIRRRLLTRPLNSLPLAAPSAKSSTIALSPRPTRSTRLRATKLNIQVATPKAAQHGASGGCVERQQHRPAVRITLTT